MVDEKITILREAGVPREAIATTLVKEKYPKLRAYIQDKRYEDRPICAIASTDPMPFYLVAKEMALSGFSVYCCELVDIHTALFTERESAEQINDTLENVQVICISGFYETTGHTGQFFTAYEAAYFRSWFMRKVYAGVKFVLLADHPVDCSGEWWSGGLLRFISRRCEQYEGKN